MPVSNDVVIITQAEFEAAKRASFLEGVRRGRFEEGLDRAAAAKGYKCCLGLAPDVCAKTLCPG